MRFQGKRALVTGAAKGIGLAIAGLLAKDGATVAVNDIDPVGAQSVADAIIAAGGNAIAASADMGSVAQIKTMIQNIGDTLGGIDILVNNAGGSSRALGRFTPFLESEEEMWDFVLGINLKGTIAAIRYTLPGMIARKSGKIVNLASITGVVGMPQIPVYSAAKGGVIALTKALAMDYAPHNITINSVSPGAINTRPGMESLANGTVLGRSGTPEDVAKLVCFLCSAEADYITGQNYVIDGGRTLGPKEG